MARLRIFAGPNGSGKSTLYSQLKGEFNVGVFVNADMLQKAFENSPFLDFNEFKLKVNSPEWNNFWAGHGLCKKTKELKNSYVESNLLVFKHVPGSYDVAVLADFIRTKLLSKGVTFSCETVFSHKSKLELMQSALDSGYRTYLYFTSIQDSATSVKRVQQRVASGGHNVPRNKIEDRYLRTMNNLLPAMRLAYRSYVFDNSGSEMNLIMEVNPDKEIKFKTNRIPVWVDDYVLSRLNS